MQRRLIFPCSCSVLFLSICAHEICGYDATTSNVLKYYATSSTRMFTCSCHNYLSKMSRNYSNFQCAILKNSRPHFVYLVSFYFQKCTWLWDILYCLRLARLRGRERGFQNLFMQLRLYAFSRRCTSENNNNNNRKSSNVFTMNKDQRNIKIMFLPIYPIKKLPDRSRSKKLIVKFVLVGLSPRSKTGLPATWNFSGWL